MPKTILGPVCSFPEIEACIVLVVREILTDKQYCLLLEYDARGHAPKSLHPNLLWDGEVETAPLPC